MLINAGIREIVFLEGYPDALSLQMLDEAGIATRVLPAPGHGEAP